MEAVHRGRRVSIDEERKRKNDNEN